MRRNARGHRGHRGHGKMANGRKRPKPPRKKAPAMSVPRSRALAAGALSRVRQLCASWSGGAAAALAAVVMVVAFQAACHALRGSAAPRPSGPPPSVRTTPGGGPDAILSAAVAAVGGRPALDALKEETARYAAVVTGADGIANPATIAEELRRDGARIDLSLDGWTFSVVCLGDRAEMVAGAERVLLSGPLRSEALHAGYDAPLEILRAWLEGAPARLLAPVGSGAHARDVVEVALPLAGEVRLEIDRATGLIAATSFRDELGEEQVDYDAWAGEGALLVPHRRVAVRKGVEGPQRIESRLVSFTANDPASGADETISKL